ncbi:CBS domain-containing protein [Streptomyces bambusae]|uniref:CBS domain-containing protein n=1 Tax=Streptomyces bambusae TaxID=1550616 RepID=UPI001CFD73D5|nr:CBS domain-containing protein [Streptomyces bambusae]MCB5164279.1 CBS domain-containing protein [Streptomyces bambusae]
MTVLVQDVMTPGVATVRPAASLAEAARAMRDRDIGDVVVAYGEQVVGILTDRDIVVRAVAEGFEPEQVTVGQTCTPGPVSVRPRDPVSAAVDLMRQFAVRRLPVMDDGHVVGIVSLGDLAVERDPGSALADISRAAPDTPPDDRRVERRPG